MTAGCRTLSFRMLPVAVMLALSGGCRLDHAGLSTAFGTPSGEAAAGGRGGGSPIAVSGGGGAGSGSGVAGAGGVAAGAGGVAGGAGGEAGTGGTGGDTSSAGGGAGVAEIDAGPGAGGSGASTGTGGTGGSGGSDGSATLPMCDSTLRDKAACAPGDADCVKTCGVASLGTKPCTCSGLQWSCGACVYPPGDYSCYALPAGGFIAPCPIGTRSNATACTGACSICSGYVDSTGTAKVGYCACSGSTADGSPVYQCASAAEWPPQSN